MEQILRVNSGEWTGDDSGREWTVFYVLHRLMVDDDGYENPDPTKETKEVFDLFDDDGRGNGTMICRGTNRNAMTSMVLRLGEFVEWKAGTCRHHTDDSLWQTDKTGLIDTCRLCREERA